MSQYIWHFFGCWLTFRLAQSWSLCLLHCFHSQNSNHSPIKFSIQNFEINNRKSERSNMFKLSAQRSMSNAGALFLDRSWHGGEQPSQSLVKWKQMSSLRTHAGSSRNELDNAQVSSEWQETWNMAGWQKKNNATQALKYHRTILEARKDRLWTTRH